ncbi:MAG TPA: UDP-N-acetylmuramate--L-alanine ligase [Candidatus Fimenecus stercoravium]|nr:UDP-N-acetylmuramate--L-alanine ligase [Candidatus Fimenecus stercoravium]
MQNIDTLLKKVRRIHFIGIGGSGMCPLAEILHSEGYQLSGSDNNPGDTLERIKALGIPVFMGQRAENIGDAEMVVYTAALLPDNPELVAARTSGVPTFERAELFGAISRLYKRCIGVCGTHGKTTTTSMLTQMLLEAELDPSAVIGGKLPKIGANGRVGKSDLFVCEACEFKDTFLSLSPSVAVILNIDEDHLDYFKTLENLIHSFHRFADMATDAVIYNGDDANTLKALEGVGEKTKITFGFSEANDWHPANISTVRGAFYAFDAVHGGKVLGRVTLAVPGKHNVLNALAALAAAIYAGADFDAARRGLEAFGGAGRRFENLGTYRGITFVDDYAHHPAELRVTLEAAMQMDFRRVWAVFQPFTYSRTYMLMDDFAEVLRIPNKCVLTEIMGSREVNTYGVRTEQLAAKIPGSVWFNTFDEVADHVLANAGEGDLVLTLGCGDIYKAAKLMVRRLKAEN